MPDISMCTSAICPARRNCYRHAESGTQPTERQPYYVLGDEQGPSEDEHCRQFWPAGQIEMAFIAHRTNEARL
jgi:hypothetical protein